MSLTPGTARQPCREPTRAAIPLDAMSDAGPHASSAVEAPGAARLRWRGRAGAFLPPTLSLPARARFGRSREPELAVLRHYVPRGSTVVDVGAHRGVYTYWLRRLVGPSGTILAFEPQPDLHDYLQSGLRPRKYANVWLRPVALSDHDGADRLVIPVVEGQRQIAWAGLDHAEAEGIGIDVEVSTLDEQLGGRPVDFVKIDVEGHEARVLTGCAGTLAARRAVWLVEIEARHAGATVSTTLGLLRDAGYRAHFLAADRSVRPIPPAYLNPQRLNHVEDGRYVNNFLFLPQ